MTEPPTPPPDDAWPVPERPAVVTEPATLIAPAAPPPLEPAPPPPDRRIGAGMLLGLAALALVVLGILLAWFLTHRGNSNTGTGTTVFLTTTASASAPSTTPSAAPAAGTAVPDLTGLGLPAARTKLSSLGLRSTTTPVTSSSKPAGTVVDQAPKAGGKVKKGSTVTLSVAAAPKATPTTTAASTTATTTAATTTAPAGSTTAPATTAPATTAPATTPAQPQNATVPDLQGQTEAGAVQALGRAGILASLAFIPGSDPLGTVVAQARPSGATVPYHSHLQINISRGPSGNPLENVPNVVGRTLQDAVSAVQGAKLRLIFLKYPVTSRAQAGKIVQQSPLSGGTAPENAQILVFLGAYRAG